MMTSPPPVVTEAVEAVNMTWSFACKITFPVPLESAVLIVRSEVAPPSAFNEIAPLLLVILLSILIEAPDVRLTAPPAVVIVPTVKALPVEILSEPVPVKFRVSPVFILKLPTLLLSESAVNVTLPV